MALGAPSFGGVSGGPQVLQREVELLQEASACGYGHSRKNCSPQCYPHDVYLGKLIVPFHCQQREIALGGNELDH